MQRIGKSPLVLHKYKKTQRNLKDLLIVLISKIRRERPPTQIIKAKFIKESNWLKQAFLFQYMRSLPLKTGLKKIAPDTRKTRFLQLRGGRFPHGDFGRTNS